jgi:hypothetical protein
MENQISLNKKIIDAGLKIMHECFKSGQIKTPQEHDGAILFQMTLLKSVSLLSLASGVNFNSEAGLVSIPLTLDPQTMFGIIRCQYESYSNFNNIFIQSSDQNELKLKYDLWVKVGLEHRQKYDVDQLKEHAKKDRAAKALYQETLAKQRDEENQINNLKQSIKDNPCFKNLDPNSQNLIEKNWQKEWKFEIKSSKANKLTWSKIMKNAVDNPLLDHQYDFLCSYTHPSNVSVFQFAAMYTQQTDKSMVKTALNLSNYFLSFFISDFISFYNMKSAFLSLPEEYRVLINFNNKMFREKVK